MPYIRNQESLDAIYAKANDMQTLTVQEVLQLLGEIGFLTTQVELLTHFNHRLNHQVEELKLSKGNENE